MESGSEISNLRASLNRWEDHKTSWRVTALFALSYFGYCGWVDWVSILVAQPCYLLEEATTRSLLRAFPALAIQESTLSHLVLILGFILWVSFLTMPFWVPSASEHRRRRLWMLACWRWSLVPIMICSQRFVWHLSCHRRFPLGIACSGTSGRNMNSRIAAFKHALNGGLTLVATQSHARFHAAATLLVIAGGTFYGVSRMEWAFLILCIAAVWTTEAINTAIEFLADEVSLEWRARIKQAKDVSAFAVLCVSIGATVIGFLVFSPYLLSR